MGVLSLVSTGLLMFLFSFNSTCFFHKLSLLRIIIDSQKVYDLLMSFSSMVIGNPVLKQSQTFEDNPIC